MDDDIPYLLLTPGPLTTSREVKQVMLHDYCTWDEDYNSIVSDIRRRLINLAQPEDPRAADRYTAVLMQGSGTFSVEATLGTAVPADGRLLVAACRLPGGCASTPVNLPVRKRRPSSRHAWKRPWQPIPVSRIWPLCTAKRRRAC